MEACLGRGPSLGRCDLARGIVMRINKLSYFIFVNVGMQSITQHLLFAQWVLEM